MSRRRNPSPIVNLENWNDDIKILQQFEWQMTIHKLPSQRDYGKKPYFEKIANALAIWIAINKKLPEIFLLDLTQKEKDKLHKIPDAGEMIAELIRDEILKKEQI